MFATQEQNISLGLYQEVFKQKFYIFLIDFVSGGLRK